MTEAPRYGQRAPQERRENCTRHPGTPAVAYCKRCNRPACTDCAIPTEVGSVCVDCAQQAQQARFDGRQYGKSPWSGQTRVPRAQRGPRSSALPARLQQSPVTAALIGINILLFLAEWVFGSRSGPIYQNLVFTPAHGFLQPWRILTTAFLHAGVMHLVFNMLMLYLLGSSIEKALGWWRYLSVYLLSAIGGSLAIILWVYVQPATMLTPTVGASGAIYGLFGAIFVAQRRAGMSVSSILVLLGINLVYGFVMPGISWQAHVGGLVVGALVTLGYAWTSDMTRNKPPTVRTTWGVVALAVMTTLVFAAIWLAYFLLVRG